ncbi:MAG: FAD-binding oxidoreductase [Desulfobulbaceae bacterium]|nr:FAD-binding oxidoreductase [Desulfobulbaceae bacterium]
MLKPVPQGVFDAVVIGGGVIGTATAYFLIKTGLTVALLERRGIASGTSGRCDGNVLIADKAPGYDMALNKASRDLFPVIQQELDYDIQWRQKGSFIIAENETEIKMCTALCNRICSDGYQARMLNRKETLQDEPFLSEDIAGGMETLNDGSLNPMALCQGLTHGFSQLGGKVYTNTTVSSIGLNASKAIEAIYTDRGKILTKAVVTCAGIWTRQLGQMVNLPIPIEPKQGQILVSEKTRYVARRKLMEFGYMAAKFGDGSYKRSTTAEMEEFGVALVFEPTESGNFLIGSSRGFRGQSAATQQRCLRSMAQRAIRFLPVIKDIKVIRSYAGLRPFTPDHLPIVSATEIPGFFVGAGHEGDGIGLSLITGQLLSTILTNKPHSIDPSPLALSRFTGKPAQSSPFC